MPINCTPIQQNMPLNALLTCAQNQVSNLVSGEKFIVQDLFCGYEWKRIKKGDRTKLGSIFFAYAQGSGSSSIDILGKTPQNQQQYQKK